MAFDLLDIVFNPAGGKWVGAIQLDAMVEENHEQNVDITEFPLEDGSTISDHMIVKPLELSITAVASSAALSVIDLVSKALNPAISVFEQLTNLKNSKSLVTVITGLKVYPNMGITQFSVTRDKDTGSALFFTMSFREVKKAFSQLIDLTNNKVQAGELQAQKPIDAGKVTSGQSSQGTDEFTRQLNIGKAHVKALIGG